MSGLGDVDPAHVGRLIVVVAVVLAVSLIAIVVTRDRPVRPDLSSVPLPEGSVTHAAHEQCSEGSRPVCTVHLAIGPAGGVELPRDTEVMLVEHLEAEGWDGRGQRGAEVEELVSPDGELVMLIEEYDQDEVPEGLDSGVDEDVDRDDLAVVVIIPAEG